MNNLHISLTEFTHASRVLKIARSLLASELVTKVFVAALYSPNLLEDEVYNPNILVKRFHLKSKGFSKKFFVQLFKYIEFAYRVYKYYSNKKIDMINIHSLALLPLGVFLKNKYKALLIYDTHELETERSGLKGCRKASAKVVERLLIKYADLVVVVSDSIADWYQAKYNIKRPLVILNAPPPLKAGKYDLFRQYLSIPQDVRIVLYQGGFLKGRGIELLLETFKSYQIEKTVIVFMGYGPLENEIKMASDSYNNIYFFPAVPPDELSAYTASADIGISFIENTCLSYYFCLPNKLFEYIMADIPVIVSNMYEMSQFVKNNKIGVVVSAYTPGGILNAVKEIAAMDKYNLKNHISMTKEKFNWLTQEVKLILAYQEILR